MFENKRPEKKCFVSENVEKKIVEVKKEIVNPELAWLFENCFPNTLDTTVEFEMMADSDGKAVPDTYVVTGDIDAMWLRDSTAQVWPYLPLVRGDERLRLLVEGVIRRQTRCILLDPYANAFYKDTGKVSEWAADETTMVPGLHERKWEVDSLCYAVRLAHGYWRQTGGDIAPFDAAWQRAMRLVVQTFREQQRRGGSGSGPYKFSRVTSWATDAVPLGGWGYPVKPCGLIVSTFRPSDDCTLLPFLIPSNMFAQVILGNLADMLLEVPALRDDALAADARALQAEVAAAIQDNAVVVHPKLRAEVLAFEVNGFGSVHFMDDANVPSLLSLPYLGAIAPDSPLYLNTRRVVLSDLNPFFYRGAAGEGIGGPHTGLDTIWPMSIILRAITSIDDNEIRACLATLIRSHAGTGFMHESFHKDNAAVFTRAWFAWANTLFGELILKLHTERPHLLKQANF